LATALAGGATALGLGDAAGGTAESVATSSGKEGALLGVMPKRNDLNVSSKQGT
jgi:hypothetical protein